MGWKGFRKLWSAIKVFTGAVTSLWPGRTKKLKRIADKVGPVVDGAVDAAEEIVE